MAPSSNLAQQLLHASLSGRSSRLVRDQLRYRLSHLAISRTTSVNSSRVGGVKWLDLDPVEQRYLLAASADSSIEALDVLAVEQCGSKHVLQPLFTVRRSHPSAHRYQVTACVWYPVDTGLFVTGSADQDVKVWDTNVLEVACAFSCQDKVLAVAMSSCAASHALIAVGTKKPQLVLADVVSGAFTHTLSGHKTGVWSVCWSPDNEHQLYSGDGSGEVRLWDVRRSGCRALLDMLVTRRPQHTVDNAANRPPAAPSSAAPGISIASQGSAACSSNPGTRHVAHEAAITCIHATQDGLSLLTAGCDNRVRLWDRQYLHHHLVHYSDTWSRGAYPKRMSSTPDGRLLFFPRGDDIQVLDVASGQQLALLSQGHFDTVTACVYSPRTSQLWSAGTDGTVLAWQPWLDEQPAAESAAANPLDWWLAAASGRRERQQQQPLAGAAPLAGSNGALWRPMADVDAWSDDDA